jgi:UDP-N-acetyl-D-glucosamine dehydrogenase
MRESPALDVLELLHGRGAVLSYTDPHVPTLDHGDLSLKSVPETDAPNGMDCAVICTNHSVFDYAVMPKRFPLVVDTRNALKNVDAENVFRL